MNAFVPTSPGAASGVSSDMWSESAPNTPCSQPATPHTPLTFHSNAGAVPYRPTESSITVNLPVSPDVSVSLCHQFQSWPVCVISCQHWPVCVTTIENICITFNMYVSPAELGYITQMITEQNCCMSISQQLLFLKLSLTWRNALFCIQNLE